ncbi:MAG TPA: helix-turn-helix domain-containing protein [Actinomycetes bacterium]|nr:helix-turn-helix domain-containing protein [Actinomycetes bacterium]
MNRPSAATVRRVERATGSLAQAALARMDDELPWYRAMGPAERSWVGLVAQAGIAAFVAWFREPYAGPAITADVFGTAPRELTRAVTLQQTVEMVRVTIDVVESRIDDIVTPVEAPQLREAVLRYSREVAFAAADVYARAAEARGAWDARLEALVVDAVLRGEADESVRSRAAALGWGSGNRVAVVVGHPPERATRSPLDAEEVVDDVRRHARAAGLDVLTGVQGDRLVAVLGGLTDALDAARSVAASFAPGPVVVGPVVTDLFSGAASARAAVAGLRAVAGWADAPRPVAAEDLLPERALAGDGHARRALVAEVYAPMLAAGPSLLETLAAYLEHGSSVEATARLLFVHPNTVRYRLRRVVDVTGRAPTDPRDAYTLRLALTLGRLMSPAADGTTFVGSPQEAAGEVRRR